MAQEHLAVANDSVLRRVPREAAATDPDRTTRCSVVSLRWRVRSVVPAAIASDDLNAALKDLFRTAGNRPISTSTRAIFPKRNPRPFATYCTAARSRSLTRHIESIAEDDARDHDRT
jgi:hypothetical protein